MHVGLVAGGAIHAEQPATVTQVPPRKRNDGDVLSDIAGYGSHFGYGEHIGEARHVAGAKLDGSQDVAGIVFCLQRRSGNTADSASSLAHITVADGASLVEDRLSIRRRGDGSRRAECELGRKSSQKQNLTD